MKKKNESLGKRKEALLRMPKSIVGVQYPNHPYFSFPNKDSFTSLQKKQIKLYAQYCEEIEDTYSQAELDVDTEVDEVTFLQQLIEDIILEESINNKYDICIVITGKEGVGKSSFAFWIAFWLSFYMHFEFNVKEHIAYNLTQFNELMLKMCFGVNWLDEGTKAFYKRESQGTLQKNTVKYLTQARKRYNVHIICSPRFTDLDEYLRSHRMECWIEVKDRGEAVVKLKKNEEIGEAWNLDDIKQHKKAHPRGNIAIKHLTCPPMPPSVEIEYERIAEEEFLNTETEDDGLDKSQIFGKRVGFQLHEQSWEDYQDYFTKFSEIQSKPFTYKRLSEMGNMSIAYTQQYIDSITKTMTQERDLDNKTITIVDEDSDEVFDLTLKELKALAIKQRNETPKQIKTPETK